MDILSADRSHDGVVIAFEDGKTALYPTETLYAIWFILQRSIEKPGPEELEES